MDQGFGLPPGHPLLASPPPGVSVRVLHDGEDSRQGAACEQPDDGTIRVEVSETVTIISAPRGALLYRLLSGQRMEEVSLGLMPYRRPKG